MRQSSLLPDADTMYEACVQRDASFEGIFVMGVRTTGIFCRPTCTARKPLRENVEFFPRSGDALAAGYRPCQRCKPMQAKGEVPEWLQPLLTMVDADPYKRWTVSEIADLQVDPGRVRRWFQAQHGMTFLAYLRARRLGQAFSRISTGSSVLESAMEADFDSVSGFCDALHRSTGQTARELRNSKALKVTQVPSPLGPLMVAGDDAVVYLVEFWDRRMLETQFAVLEQRLGVVFFPGETPPMQSMRRELSAYFKGELKKFTTPILFPGSTHQQQVWQELLKIPHGETWSYAQLADSLGKPAAVRAVSKAVGENRLAIVVPCHRVVGSNGRLTGYGGGLWRKRYLLSHEGGAEPGMI